MAHIIINDGKEYFSDNYLIHNELDIVCFYFLITQTVVFPITCARRQICRTLKNQLSKGEGTLSAEGCLYFFLILSGANLAHTFTKIPMKQKEKKNQNFLTVRPYFGPNIDSVFANQNLLFCFLACIPLNR